jgi:hypothetical protein
MPPNVSPPKLEREDDLFATSDEDNRKKNMIKFSKLETKRDKKGLVGKYNM